MEQLATLDSYCQLSKTSLVFKRDVTQDEWKHVFNSLKLIEGCVQFWIGDCLKYREQKWGMYDDVAKESGYNVDTLKDYKYVADKVKESLRNDNLEFAHHKAVAPLQLGAELKHTTALLSRRLVVIAIILITPVLLAHNLHRIVGYRPWDREELDK